MKHRPEYEQRLLAYTSHPGETEEQATARWRQVAVSRSAPHSLFSKLPAACRSTPKGAVLGASTPWPFPAACSWTWG